MNADKVTDAERAAALDRLLMTYAMAVARMRALQQQRKPHEPMSKVAERAEAETEVDSLTQLYLIPRVS